MESPSNSFSTLADVTVSPAFSSSSLFASTPTRKRPRNKKNLLNDKTKFKKPRLPPAGPPKATCATCGKEYRSLSYYDKHIKMHVLKDAAARVPDINVLQSKSRTIGRNALTTLKNNPAVGKYGQQYNKLIEDLLQSDDLEEWQNFITFLSKQFTAQLVGKSITLPSAMLSNALMDVEKITSSFSIRTQCLEMLSSLPCTSVCSSQVLCIFFSDFVFNFCDQFLILLSRTLRNADEVVNSVHSVNLDEKDRRTIHNVAGASVKGFVRFGRRYPKNKYWIAVLECLKARVIENPEIAPASDSDRAWTEILSKGALTFVGKEPLEFFLSVAKIISKTDFENASRALPHDSIIECVFKGESKYIWDSIIGNFLKEDWSLLLMQAITKSFTHTYGRGVAMKLINAASKNKPFCAVPLRPSLAPRGPLPTAPV
ncbi:uncharacterized protein LOC127751123 [Frankliniella occidentalis]|uniref:Uncharacterized protein LOC127751123 n=1 Tax=Frankliniella occidentalis TaxID=133901 RepID=A0A9C6X6S7_FRAOC|nr:uncharacterized protein LOC127751123 [Frankliniella occidentalis]